MSTPPDSKIDLLVVTALKLKRLAVCAHLDGLEVETDSGLFASRGSFAIGDRQASVAVIETGAGNIEAAVLTARAEEYFRPETVAMTGVAGALKDVDIGDVVVSS